LEDYQVNYRRELLDKANAWCKATGRTLSHLGRLILKDGAFFIRLKKKKSRCGCRPETYFKIKKWFHKNMPELNS